MIDHSLPELEVVTLDINDLLNAPSQTRSLVASRLTEDHACWACMAHRTGNKEKSLTVYSHYFQNKPDPTGILSLDQVLSIPPDIVSLHKLRYEHSDPRDLGTKAPLHE